MKLARAAEKPEVAASLSWMGRTCESRGWAYEVWSGCDSTLLANVRWLDAEVEVASRDRRRRPDITITTAGGARIAVEVQYARMSVADQARARDHAREYDARVWLLGHVRDNFAARDGTIRLNALAQAIQTDGATLLWLNAETGAVLTAWDGDDEHGPRPATRGVARRWEVVPVESCRLDGQYGILKFSLRTTRDLAIRDFYTFIDIHGQPNAMLEAILGRVESGAGSVLRKLTNAFIKDVNVDGEDLVQLALFAGFQVMHTPRRQREMELQTDWFAKTTMRGHISEDELARLTVLPHKNHFVETIGPMGERLVPFFRARPLALVTLDQPSLLTGDEPVIVNAATDQNHHADCFLTDEQIAARVERERRKKKRLQRDVSRVVHLWSPVPHGVGTAAEVVLPISPRSALVWGPLHDGGDVLTFEREKLTGAEAERFASHVNDAICSQALDWIVTQPGDTDFKERNFPEPGPLLRTCDGANAASDAINTTPKPMRPRRLTPS